MCKPYHLLLAELSQALSSGELHQLVFACGDVLTDSQQERIKTATDLFKVLKHKAKIAPQKYDYLKERLSVIGRLDLAKQLPSSVDYLYDGIHRTSHFGGFKYFFLVSSDPEKTYPRGPPGLVFRSNLLKVAEQLTEQDVKNMAFLVEAPHLTLATEIFQHLQQEQQLAPDNWSYLADCLSCIGRQDLAELLDRLFLPVCLPQALSASHQMLSLKCRELLRRRDTSYTSQLNGLCIIANADHSVVFKVVVPLIKKLNSSYSYQTISSTYCESKICETRNFDSVVSSTLSSVFKFFGSHYSCISHVHTSPQLDVGLLVQGFKCCVSSFAEFDATIHPTHWNCQIRDAIHRDIEQRVTPMGSPALTAGTYINDVCSELCGKDSLSQDYQSMDKQLFFLECFHYCFCQRVVLTEWLATLTYLSGRGRLDLSCQRDTLLRILREHTNYLKPILPSLSHILGSQLMDQLGPVLASVDVASSTKSKTPLDYLQASVLPGYTFLLQLIAISFFGPEHVAMETIGDQQVECLEASYSSELFAGTCLAVIRGALLCEKRLVIEFRDKAFQANKLCSPLLQQLTRDTSPC